MNVFVEKLLERPTSHKLLLWLGSLGIIFLLFWQYSYSSLMQRADELGKDIESLNSQILTEQRTVRNLSKFRKEVESLESLKGIALKQLPYKKDIPNLLNSITSLAKDSGLEVVRFAPDKEVVRDFYAEVPVQLEFKGNFIQLMSFFDDVSKLSRIVSVGSIQMGNPKGYQEQIQVAIDGSCRLTTYRHLEENEKVQVEEKASEQQKRRKTK